MTAIADENVLLQYYTAVEVEVSFPGREFLKPPSVSSYESKAGHHMEKHGLVEDHLSLGCYAKHLAFHPLIFMIEKFEILPLLLSF